MLQYLTQVINKNTMPYVVAAVSIAAASYAFAGWIDAERKCAERESEIQRSAQAQIQKIISDCEADKQEALKMLREYVKEQSDRYTELLRAQKH